MKVLNILTSSLHYNGIAMSLLNYYKYIDSEKIQMDFLVPNKVDSNLKKQFTQNGNKMFELYYKNKKMHQKRPILYCITLYKIIKNEKYDIVHVHGSSSLLFLQLLSAKIAGVKIRIAHSRNTESEHKKFNIIFKPLFNKQIEKALKYNFYYIGREWPYKNVKPRILIEQYMEDNIDKELRDYKFYCFNGYAKAILVATNRQSRTEELCFDYFDENYNHLALTNHWHPNSKITPHKPKEFNKMKELAKKLSMGFPHIRADFYEVNGKVYFGEITFFDMSGCLKIHPDNWDKEWGSLIKLPEKNIKK